MVSLFFGAVRPETVVSARIELKIPLSKTKGINGRPMKVWTGTSDADETQVYMSICENKILAKVIRDRQILEDGSIALEGTLTYTEGAQLVSRHEIEVVYFDVNVVNTSEDIQDFALKLLEMYGQQLAQMRADHFQVMKANAEAYGKLGESFSNGLAKQSKQHKGLSKQNRRLEKDRAHLTAALIKSLGDRRATAATSEPSKLMTGIEAMTLLAKLRDKAGTNNDSGNNNV